MCNSIYDISNKFDFYINKKIKNSKKTLAIF